MSSLQTMLSAATSNCPNPLLTTKTKIKMRTKNNKEETGEAGIIAETAMIINKINNSSNMKKKNMSTVGINPILSQGTKVKIKTTGLS